MTLQEDLPEMSKEDVPYTSIRLVNAHAKALQSHTRSLYDNLFNADFRAAMVAKYGYTEASNVSVGDLQAWHIG